VTENQLIFLDSLTRSVVDAREDGLSAKEIDEVVKNLLGGMIFLKSEIDEGAMTFTPVKDFK
jgi:hypothetical protein